MGIFRLHHGIDGRHAVQGYRILLQLFIKGPLAVYGSALFAFADIFRILPVIESYKIFLSSMSSLTPSSDATYEQGKSPSAIACQLNGIHDLAVVNPRTLSARWQERFEQRPFTAAQI